MKRFLPFILVFLFFVTHAQEKRVLTLDETIELAKRQSPAAKAAENRFANSYWQYKSFKASRLPMLTLQGTIPNFNRNIEPIVQDNGTIDFVSRSLSEIDFNLRADQVIPPLGGQVFVSSAFSRVDNYEPNTSTQYLSAPVLIGYNQPIFSYNPYRWDKKIEPLKYKEAKNLYLEEMEGVAIEATQRFFNMYLAQINLEISLKNKANNDTLYRISKGRYNLGKIAENELLQMELSLLNADLSVEQAIVRLKNASFELSSYLGIDQEVEIELVSPETPNNREVSVPEALDKAKQNRAAVITFEKNLTIAEGAVAQARGQAGFNANIYATYGVTKNTEEFDEVLEDPREQQRVRVGFSVPITDWGRSKALVKMAVANQELVKTNIAQAKIDFEQEIFLAVQEYNMQAKQFRISAKADTIAGKRFFITKQRFLIGKIDITDLNLASVEQDQAKRSYVEALRSYWTSWIRLRQLTLYDFTEGKDLEIVEDRLID